MNYMDKEWRKKIVMWCIATRNLPHAGQNTNVGIEAYHANLKIIMFLEKHRLVGRILDWCIDSFITKVHSHYWYHCVLKGNGFIRNINQEVIVASAIQEAFGIPDDHVYLYPDGDDVALVMSADDKPHVRTVHSPNSSFAQCECPTSLQGMICMHVMKVFRMINPGLETGFILKEADTTYGVNKTTPMSQTFSQASTSHNPPMLDVIKEDKPHHDRPGEVDFPIVFSDVEDITLVDTVYFGKGTCVSIEEAVDPSQTSNSISKPPSGKAKFTANDPEAIFHDIYTNTEHNSHLREHLVAELKNIRGKMNVMMARGVGSGEQVPIQPTFPTRDGDNSLKRKQGPLERKCRRVKKS
jgi:hypothetical protein